MMFPMAGSPAGGISRKVNNSKSKTRQQKDKKEFEESKEIKKKGI